MESSKQEIKINKSSARFNARSSAFFARHAAVGLRLDDLLAYSDDAKEVREDRNFRFLMEKEVQTLMAVLKNNRRNREAYIDKCIYFSRLLQDYNLSNAYARQAKEFAAFEAELRAWKADKAHADPVSLGWEEKLAKGFYDYFGMSNIIKQTSRVNVVRIFWLFNRYAAKNFALATVGTIGADSFIKNIEWPNPFLTDLSVDIFAFRLALHSLLCLKHIYLNPASWNSELRKRGPTMLNDIVWCLVNEGTLKASYNVAMGVTSGFLFFDICLILFIRFTLAYFDYRMKRDQLEASLVIEGIDTNIVNEQITELDLEWKNTKSEHLFNAAAAVVVFSGFSLALAGGPLVMAVLYTVGMIGVAMYMTAEAYGVWQGTEARESLSLTKSTKDAAYEKKLEFRSSLFIKTVILPPLFVTVLATSWPIALLTIVAAIASVTAVNTAKDYVVASHHAKPAP